MAAEQLARVRSFVSYSLQRRATLLALRRGGTSQSEVCDAHPYLLRAARFHGEPTRRDCPVCGRVPLTLLRYVYSDELGQYSGRLRTAREVVSMSRDYGRLSVYVVEVCTECGWNHLVASFEVGDGVPRRPPRRTPTVQDRYG
jgi:Family of unknown function (DUF5318)